MLACFASIVPQVSLKARVTMSRSFDSGMASMGRPSMRIVPGGGSKVRVIKASKVDFPLPVRPTMPSVSPSPTVRLTSRRISCGGRSTGADFGRVSEEGTIASSRPRG